MIGPTLDHYRIESKLGEGVKRVIRISGCFTVAGVRCATQFPALHNTESPASEPILLLEHLKQKFKSAAFWTVTQRIVNVILARLAL